MLELVLFYIFAAIAVVSAILVITRHNVVHSAAFLGATLFAVAGIFLTLHAELTKNPLAFHTAVETIVKRGRVARKTSIEDSQRKIADFYKLDPRDFQSQQRSRRVAPPRQVAMFLAREITARSLPEIGRRFGGRDHTTVLHACRRIAALCNEDPTFKQEIDFLKQVLGKEN